MKKIFLTLFFVAAVFSFVFAAEQNKETPASIYAKIIDKSYIGKYKSIIIDKEITSTQLSKGVFVKSKTYFSGNKFREETTSAYPDGQTINIVTIFTSSDTYLSYNQGESFFSLGSSLVEEISSIQFNPSINDGIFIPKNVSAIANIPGLGNVKDVIQSLF
jgi:hypothetical protein